MLITKLRDYQIEARDEALKHPGFGLFLEQRTGKTPVALAVVDKRKPEFLFIICPKKVIPVWIAEIEKHLKITWDMEIEIINFEQLLPQKKQLYKRTLKEWPKFEAMIICDESHRLKQRGSKISKVARHIARGFKWRLALTGTPISPKKISRGKKSYVVEGWQDLWAQYDFIDPSIFGPYAVTVRDPDTGRIDVIDGFEHRFCVRGGFKKHQVIGYRNERLLQKIFHQYSYRKTLQEVSSYRVKLVKRFFDLEDQPRVHYEEIEEYLETLVEDRRISAAIVLAASMKLQQITGGFLIDTITKQVFKIGNAKLNSLRKLLISRKVPGEPWIIITRFTHEIEAILELGRKLNLATIAISGKNEYDETRCRESDIIVLQIASGVGIDISVASTTVYYTADYSYINQEQSKFRMLSYGKKRITYYYLLARDTIDEIIYLSITKKKDLASLICDHYRNRQQVTIDEIIQHDAQAIFTGDITHDD